MYTTINFKTKKALKVAVATGALLTVYQPNADPTEVGVPRNGTVYLEGPHCPAPHTWYAEATLKDGYIIKVK